MRTGNIKPSKIAVELQYFDGCPNSHEMIHRVKEAIKQYKIPIEYHEILINTPEKAEEFEFRGSPTVLINGNDLEGMPAPITGNLSCRYYKNGLPSVETIIKILRNSANKER
jgi:hypothetical protein